MRIWILTSELPPETGGIATYVDGFGRLLAARGQEVVVIAPTEQPRDQMEASSFRVIGFVPRAARLAEDDVGGLTDTHPAYPYNVIGHAPGLSYELAERVLGLATELGPPDIIEAQDFGGLPYYLLQRRLTERTPLTQTPVLVHLHTPFFEVARVNHEPRFRFPEYWIGQMEKFCLVAADRLLSPSRFLARAAEETLRRPLDVACIPYPLRLPTLEEGARPAERREVVYVGRLEIRKGVLPLVAACSRLWAAGEEFQLTLIGGDVRFVPRETTVATFLRERYRRWIESGHLTLAGRMDRAQVLERVRRAWATVVPSVWDNFPNTCMEAMGMGQVVLASTAGGQMEMVGEPGKTGFLFDWARPGDFEENLHRVLTLEAGERAVIGAAARERIRTLCDPEQIVERRLEHYAAAVAAHAPPRVFPSLDGAPGEGVVEARAEGCSLAGSEEPGLLTVVIPFHDLGEYVSETLESVLASTYAPLEVIVVDDGSTEEGSIEALRAIERRGLPNVRVLHIEHQGLAGARNAGVDAARGEFVTFVDADDLVEPDFFARAIDVLRRYANVAFVYSWVRYVGEGSGIWPTWNTELPYFLGQNMLSAFVVLRRTAFLRWARNKPEMEYSLEDYDAWLALVLAGGVGVSLPFPLVRYRVRGGSMYRSTNQDQILYLRDLMTRCHAEAYRRWGPELVNLLNANGPSYRWNNPVMAAHRDQDVVPSRLVPAAVPASALRGLAERLGEAIVRVVRPMPEEERRPIEAIRQSCVELMTVLRHDVPPALAQPLPLTYEDALDRRVVSRLRTSWIGRQLLARRLVRQVLKWALRV